MKTVGPLREGLRRRFLTLMVWNMRWMTRYLGFIARPLVRWVASREVIACGLRSPDGEAVSVIYSPFPGHRDHAVKRRDGGRWQDVDSQLLTDFSSGLICQQYLPAPSLGDTYVVRAQQLDSAGGGWVSSPRITVKGHTQPISELLDITNLPRGEARFSWQGAGRLGAMIYFLVLEGGDGRAYVGIYTRELSWTYPRLRDASLAIGESAPPPLLAGRSYTVKLLLVDFEGWVSHLAARTFQYADVGTAPTS